jgi:hypothetical protein
MPHLIRDEAKEVLKDFLLLKVISSEGRHKAFLLAAGVRTNPARPEAGEELIRVLRNRLFGRSGIGRGEELIRVLRHPDMHAEVPVPVQPGMFFYPPGFNRGKNICKKRVTKGICLIRYECRNTGNRMKAHHRDTER